MLSNLWKALNLAAAYISLENCRACKQAVNNRRPLKPPQSLCMQCWMRLLKTSAPLVAADRTEPVPIKAAGVHSGLLRKLIIKLKQNEDPLLARDLSHLLLKNTGLRLRSPVPQLLVPMPLHKKRLRSRGFNQSELLARQLSSILGLPLSIGALKRIIDTPSQRSLHKDQRRINMQGAFAAHSNLVKNKTIILVDDVHTSGATMQAAAQALFDAGATDVTGVCVAAAPLLYSRS